MKKKIRTRAKKVTFGKTCFPLDTRVRRRRAPTEISIASTNLSLQTHYSREPLPGRHPRDREASSQGNARPHRKEGFMERKKTSWPGWPRPGEGNRAGSGRTKPHCRDVRSFQNPPGHFTHHWALSPSRRPGSRARFGSSAPIWCWMQRSNDFSCSAICRIELQMRWCCF